MGVPNQKGGDAHGRASSGLRTPLGHHRPRVGAPDQRARYDRAVSPTFRGGEYLGVRIPTVFEENDAIRCEGCGEPIKQTPFRVSLLDIVPSETAPSWAIGAAINPGPHQFHAQAEHFRLWARRRGYLFCRLSDVREIMRPIAVPGETPRWGLCDGNHREAHELVPA